MSGWIDWPTEPGYYWFYGWPSGDTDLPVQLVTGRAASGALNRNGTRDLHVTARGHFAYKSEAVGKWLPLSEPELPDLTEDPTHA